MKFIDIYNTVKKHWPSRIPISDGYDLGNGGYMFPSLNKAYDLVETKVLDNDWEVLMAWVMFQSLHVSAKNELITKKNLVLNIDEVITPSDIKVRYMKALRQKDYKDMLQLFITENPM